MQRNLNHLIGWNLDATDGEIGKVDDFYFDDGTWTIRYLVVKTGNWLSGRKVLISPHALLQHSWESGLLPVRLTKEQVRNSPDIDTDKPVSRQQEDDLFGYYSSQGYWEGGLYPGGFGTLTDVGPMEIPYPADENAIIHEADNTDRRIEGDPHLRSCAQVAGYYIHASDGDIGHVNEFIFDDQTWQVAYLLVDTHNWIGGKKVLVAVRHIKSVEWENSKVLVDMTVDAIKSGGSVDKWDYIIPEGDNAQYHDQAHHADAHPSFKGS